MGRYSQRQRRGGGQSAAAPVPPPTPTSVSGVSRTEGSPLDQLAWIFTTAVNLVGAAPAALETEDPILGWVSPASASQLDASTIVCNYPGGTFAGGQAWRLFSTPEPDLTSDGGFDVPEAGPVA